MKLERIVEPAPPLTLSEAKSHLRVVHAADDAYITSLIARAADFVEGYYGAALALGEQTWQLHLDGFAAVMTIPIWPCRAINTITYRDAAGASQTLADFDADIKANPATITALPGGAFPDTDGKFNSVTIEFVAGFVRLPGDLAQALLLLIGHWYENREAVSVGGAVSEYPLGFEAILNKYAARGFA